MVCFALNGLVWVGLVLIWGLFISVLVCVWDLVWWVWDWVWGGGFGWLGLKVGG